MSEFAVITGGSTGIGRHLVTAFANAGYAVAFSFKDDDDAAQSLVEAIEAGGGQALGIGMADRNVRAASGRTAR